MEEKVNRYSKEQKIGLILLSAFVLLAVTLGLIQIRNTIHAPFALNTSIPPLIGKEVNTIDALRYRDTDGDGLSDYDELYIYGTSPYLWDTDGDGISDYDEIMRGTNPLCPEGQVCGNIADSGDAIPIPIGHEQLFDMTGEDIFPDIDVLFSPENMRLILIDSGLDKSVVDMISDEEINQMVIEILTSEEAFSESDIKNTNPEDVQQAIDYFNKLMAEQENN